MFEAAAKGRHAKGKHLRDSRFSRSSAPNEKNIAIQAALPSIEEESSRPQEFSFVRSDTSSRSSEEHYVSPYGSHASARIDSLVGAEAAPINVSAGKKRKKGRLAATFLSLLLVGAVAAGAWWFWSHRPITIQLNGQTTETNAGVSLDDLLQTSGASYTPGNLISVGGNLLQEGGGNAYRAIVNGEELSLEDRLSYRLGGDTETVEFADGDDAYEEYELRYREIQPLMYIEGDWGSVSYVHQWGIPGKIEERCGKISGETVDGETVQEVQNCIIRRTTPVPDNGERLVTLTFDDGPSAYTQDYIDILKRYGVHATFFNLGENVDEYPEQAKAIVESGNQLCSHTYHHDELTSDDAERFMSEVSSAFDAIERASGTTTSVIRPPYGEFSPQKWLESKGLISASILWTQDSQDWSLPGVDAIVEGALANVESGSIILLHDGGGNRDQSVEALPKIIEALQADGYKIVTLAELLASDSSIPEEIATCTATLPEDAVWPQELG